MMEAAGSPASRARMSSSSRVVFVGAHKQPNFVVESYQEAGRTYALKDGEILLKMRTATICEDDLELLDNQGIGQIGHHPRVLGHEGVGEVVASRFHPVNGNEVEIQAGDRLIFSPWSGACAECTCCSEDQSQLCPNAQKYGQQTSSDEKGPVLQGGTFASYLVLRKGTLVALLPDGISNALASPLACALAPLVNAFKVLEGLRSKDVAVVQGGRVRGAFACALLHDMGFLQVYCHDGDADALKLITGFRATPVHESYLPSSVYVRQNYGALKPGSSKSDVVVRLGGSSSGSSVTSALNMLRPGGYLILVGTGKQQQASSPTNPGYKQPTAELCWDIFAHKGITVKGISGYGQSDLQSAVEFVNRTSSIYPYESLLGHLHPSLYDFPNAISTAKSNRNYRIPVIIS